MADAAIDPRAAKALDAALSGSAPADPGIARMVEAAETLREKLAYEMPDFRAERAAFVQGVGGRARTWGWMRFFGPATVAAIALMVAVMLGRTALPGEALYPVRQALRAVGLAPFSLTEIDGEIHDAKQLLAQAEGLKNSDIEQAQELAFEAVKVLGFAEEILPEVDDRGNGREAQVKALLRKAQAILLTEPKEGGRGDDRVPGAEKEPGAKNGPKDKPPGGNSGAVRQDGDKPDRDDRSDKSDDHGKKTAKDKRDDNRADGSNKGPGSRDDQGEDKEDVLDDDSNDDDLDDGNSGRGNDDKEDKDKDKDDDGDDENSTPDPEETTDDLKQDVKDTIRNGHNKKSQDDKDHGDDGDDENDGDDD